MKAPAVIRHCCYGLRACGVSAGIADSLAQRLSPEPAPREIHVFRDPSRNRETLADVCDIFGGPARQISASRDQ